MDEIVASAEPFLGSVRLISRDDLTLDYRAWNDRTIREALHAAGWTGGRIAYLSTYDPRYTRTETLLAMLRRNAMDVDTYIFDGRAPRLLSVLPRLRQTYGAFILGFRGHHLLPFVRSLLGSRPLLFDAFTSLFDTLCEDRGIIAPGSMMGQAIQRFDRMLCRSCDAVLVDTQTNAAHFREAFGAANVFPIYVECNETLFCLPAARVHEPVLRNDGPTILWYGTCQPLHGVDRILRWAKNIENEASVRFRLVGPVYARHRALVRKLHPRNIDFIDHVPYDELPAEIARATLCLAGPFGESAKAKRVITAKTYQMLVCGKPVLIGDTPATRELFSGVVYCHVRERSPAPSIADDAPGSHAPPSPRGQIPVATGGARADAGL